MRGPSVKTLDGNINVATQDGYDIATGMRGPDHIIYAPEVTRRGAYLTKIFTACVVRYFVGCPYLGGWQVTGYPDFILDATGGGMMINPDDAIKLWNAMTDDDKECVNDFFKRNTHFAGHFHSAMMALDYLNVEGAHAYHMQVNDWMGKV